MKHLRQLGIQEELKKFVKVQEIEIMHPEREAAVIPEHEDTLKKDIHDAKELMKSLSLNWVEFVGRGRGRGIMGMKVKGAFDSEASPGGIGRGK